MGAPTIYTLFGQPVSALRTPALAAREFGRKEPVQLKELAAVTDVYLRVYPFSARKLMTLGRIYFSALKRGNIDEALITNQRIAQLIQQTPPKKWRKIIRLALSRLHKPINRFADPKNLARSVEDILAKPPEPKPPSVSNRLRRQRAYFFDHGRFEFSDLKPKTVSQMSPLEQLAVAKQFIEEVERASMALYDNIQSLRKNDVAGWIELNSNYDRNTGAWVDLRSAKLSPEIDRLVHNLFSSAIQQISASRTSWTILYRLERGELTWEQALQALSNPHRKVGRMVREDPTPDHPVSAYEISRARIELADSLFFWLAENFSAKDRTTTGWIFKGPNQPRPLLDGRFPITHWPPDPGNDIVLKTYLELLGWKMTVKETPEHVVVRVDFGANAI